MAVTSLYVVDGKILYDTDLSSALRRLGINAGDHLFMHSDIGKFGRLAAVNRHNFLTSIIESILLTVTPGGTLIMPTFTYSFCRNEVFDQEKSPSTVGALTEFFRNCHGVTRSAHPIFSVAALGQKQDYFCDVSMDAFGAGSIFEKMYLANTKIVFLGARFHACTYLHYIEQCLNVPYRFKKKFLGISRSAAGEKLVECTYLVRPLNQNVNLDTRKLESALCEAGLLKRVNFGDGEIMAISATDLLNVTGELLKKDIYFLLKSAPYV